MGTITSGIGLVSGINTSSIIDQLMKIEQQPVDNLQTRIDAANKQKLALVDLSTQLASIKLYATTLKKPSTFTAAKATSSNEDVLTATTTGSPTPGSYQFQVARLVTTQQAMSNGFANYNTSTVGAGTITIEQGGGDLTNVANLSQLKGASGAGVSRGQFRITDRSGHSAVIDISAAVTLDDVVKKINTAVDVSVKATVTGDGLQIADQSGGAGNIVIQDLAGGSAASDLGIAKNVAAATLTGDAINGLSANTTLSSLNDGRGVRRSATGGADFRITFADGTNNDIDLSSAKTMGDVLSAINNAAPGKIQAQVAADGHSLQLTDLTQLGGDFTITAQNGSSAAADLGILGTGHDTMNGSWVLSKLNTVLLSTLNGGQGLATGSFDITTRDGSGPVTVDLSAAKTVQDVLDAINNSGANVTASLKSSGNGIQITDTSNGTGPLVIADDGASTVAGALGIAGSFSAANVQGANLQRQWITENSALSSYNGGKGVGQGVIRITNTKGVATVVDLSSTSMQRLGDVIQKINSSNAGVTASINAHGDGLLLTDNAAGTGKLAVEDLTSTTAADLQIKGTSANGTTIDGTFERTIDVTATDTLATLQTKIQTLGFGVGAQIINDGTDAAPYRLSLTAKNTGIAGRVVLDMGTTSVGMQNLVDAQDAAVFVGGTTGAQPLLITASRNQIAGVIPGVSIDLHSVSSSPVTLDVSRNIDTGVDQMQKFTDGFNAIVDKIADLTKFDPSDPSSKGILLGDSTVQGITDRIYSALNTALKEGGRFKVLADVGLTIGDGGKLAFDEDKFREAYATDPDSVQKMFTYLETTKDDKGNDVSTGKGLGYVLENAITSLIDPVSGTITQENQTLDSRTQGFQDRITQLNALIDAKRTRLENQFAQMESVLAQLQSQQSSLGQIKSATPAA